MKQFKRFSLAYTLQVFGVIMLFGYPGCSANIKEQKIETATGDKREKKHADLSRVLNKAPQLPAAVFSLRQPEAAQINFASYLNFSK